MCASIEPLTHTSTSTLTLSLTNAHSYAYDAGMRVGDRLLAVDGVPVKGRTVDQARGAFLLYMLVHARNVLAILTDTHIIPPTTPDHTRDTDQS